MPVHTCVAECARNGGYICHWGHPFFEDVPLVEFIYLVFTRMPGGATVGDSGLCCCVPCLSNAVFPFVCLLYTGALGLNLFQIIIITIIMIIVIISYPLTSRVVGAPQMISQPVSFIFPCSPLPSGTCRTPGLSIP